MKLTDARLAEKGESIENIADGYYILQREDDFRFGTDAVMLSDFTVVKPGDSVMDFCTGTGIIPLLLHKKMPKAHYIGLEFQPHVAEMAQRSVKLNGLTDDISIIPGDVCRVRELFPAESFQVVTCNPPYMKNKTGKKNTLESVSAARHEIFCTLEDCISAASYLLPSGGRFYMIHRPERLTDIMELMRRYKLEPKRMTIFSAGSKPPKLLVVEGQKNRKSGLILRVAEWK